jgi:hypothetical protein
MLRGQSGPAAAVGRRRRRRVGGACVLAAAVVVFALKLGVAGAAWAVLPDGRVYEQVSAAKKNGNEAATELQHVTHKTLGSYATADAGGGMIAYAQGGPAGETFSGADLYSLSRRNPQSGWETSSVVPPEYLSNGDFLGQRPLTLLPSADYSRFLFAALGPFVKENSLTFTDENLGLYRTRGNSSEPEWLTSPTAVSQGMGEVTEKSTDVKNVHGLNGGIKSPLELPLGARVFGQKIPAGTTITRVTSTEIELANAVEGGGATATNEELEVSIAKPAPGTNEQEGVYPVGASPDLSTVYFTYFGTLVPTDESRYPLVEPLTYQPWSSTKEYGTRAIVEEENGEEFSSCEMGNIGHKPTGEAVGLCVARRGNPAIWWEKTKPTTQIEGPWGFYEWHAGEPLRSAGELPEHGYSPYGAVPAVTQNITASSLKYPLARYLGNEVSRNGSRAFFISPQNLHAGEAGAPVELYVREQTPAPAHTVLVSRDELLPGSPPAEAAGCTKTGSFSPSCAETAVTPVKTQKAPTAYVYASPDGSRAFFESMDKLAKSAPPHEKEPEGSGPWTYEFNLEAEGGKGKLTYLPGVVGPIAASSQDGSSFIFKNTGTKKIELWTGGPPPEEVASFEKPAPESAEFEGTATNDGKVFVFNTNAVLRRGAQEFNNAAIQMQAYRYDVSSQRLSCVSCAPDKVTTQHRIEDLNNVRGQGREIDKEGKRVFFATATKLVPQAEHEVENVYEWEQAGTGGCQLEEQEGGCIYLLSSGKSPDPSFYLDNDESGENVFFTTGEGLVKSDTDQSYDVYDARVGGGFPEPPPPAECGGACRTAVVPTLSAPLAAALGPPENTTRVVEEQGTLHEKSENKPVTRAQRLAKALRACAKQPKRKHPACVKRARRLFGAKATTKRHAGRRRG